MTGLGVVGKDIVDGVTAEFILEMERMGLVFERDIDGSLKAMEDQITAETLSKVKAHQSGSAEATAWGYISKTDAGVLALRIAAENPRVGAVILSKLSPAKSAEIVGQIATETAEAILEAISKTTSVKPEIVNRIGIALADSLQDKGGVGAFEDSAAERIGAILNMSASQFRDGILGSIEKKDPEAAGQIRRLMFTFEDIPSRITGRDISKILRGVDDETLVMALSGAATSAPAVKEFVMANISSRLAEQIEESIGERGAVKEKDADAAMTQVVIAIKELEKSGEITLIEEEEEEE
jgi:flagellar motor switch protein FliG